MISVSFKNYVVEKDKITALKKEISDLQQKNTIIYSFDKQELDQLINTMNELLPGKEDFYSIFTTLEKISEKSGFVISSYIVDFNNKTNDKISLTIEGQGSPDELLKFFQDYKFGGGRLVTMDHVSFSPSTTETSLILNFYAKDVKVNGTNALKVDKKTFDLIRSVNKNISQTVKENSQEQTNGDYIPKEDPFK